MHQPEIYARTNFFERRDSKEIFEELKSKLKWDQRTGDSLLDIGCGPGDVTIDYILPALSKNYGKLVGSDISENMIEYAKKTYGHLDPRIKFELMNIESENLKITEQFDHVTSMFCFNLVRNHRQAVQNVYNLLKPEGDTVLQFVSTIGFYNLREKQSENPKWKPFMTDLVDVLNPSYYSKDPVGDFKEYLTETGFKDILIDCKERVFELSNWDDYLDFVRGTDRFYARTGGQKEKYLKDFAKETKNLNFVEENNGKIRIKIPYKAIFVYAKKF